MKHKYKILQKAMIMLAFIGLSVVGFAQTTKIFYTSKPIDAPNETIYRMNTDGTEQEKLFEDNEFRRTAVIIRDYELYYIKRINTALPPHQNSYICKSDLDGNNETVIYTNTNSDYHLGGFDLSPDKAKIAFTLYSGDAGSSSRNGDLWIFDINSSTATNLTNNDNYYDWSVVHFNQTNSKILYNHCETTWFGDPMNMYVIDTDGNNNTALNPSGSGVYRSGAYSTDGTKIVYSFRPSFYSGPDKIFIANSDGTNAQEIYAPSSNVGAPRFHNNDTEIAFSHERHLKIIDLSGNLLSDINPDGIGYFVFTKIPTFSVQTEADYAKLNNSVKIPVTTTSELTIDNGIYSYQFVYSFDNTKLAYTGYDLTGLISEGGTVEVNTDTPGELAISWMQATPPLVGTGDLINLQFNAIAEGTSNLTITNFKYNETDVTAVTNGDITIVTPTTADITYSTDVILSGTELVITATFNRPLDDSPVTQITLSGANTLSATNMIKVSETVYTYTYTVQAGDGIVNVALSQGTDEYGFEIENTPITGATFEILALTYGDVTDNGEITAYDAALALMYSVGVDPMPSEAPLPWELWRILTANVDGINDVTATDAGLILQYSVGLIDEFPVESSDKSGQSKDGDITVEIVDNEFVFTSQDELLGFNLYVTNNSDVILGEPDFLDQNMLSASQIEGETYNVGTCIAISPANGTQIMKIPFTGELTGELIFDMKVNNTDKTMTFGTTGIAETNTKGISVYPNPVTDKIMITSSVALDNSTIEIYSVSGRLIKQTSLNDKSEISVNDLSKGIYILKINSETVNFVERIIKE